MARLPRSWKLNLPHRRTAAAGAAGATAQSDSGSTLSGGARARAGVWRRALTRLRARFWGSTELSKIKM